jgi:cytochrome P450
MTSQLSARLFDPVDPDFLADPYPLYARLREIEAPVVRGGPAQWIAARYDPVAALLKDPRMRNDFPPQVQQMKLGEGDACDFVVRSALHQEAADHALLRRFLGRVVYARPMESLRGRIAELVDELLAPALARGELEVVGELALPLPLAVACELVGIPAGDRAQVQQWGLDVVQAFTVELPADRRPSVNAAVRRLREYFADVPAGELAAPLAAALRELDGAGRIDRDVLVDNVVFLFVSGFTTTVHLIASGCAALLDHPDQWARLRRDRSLVPGAVEECLRHDAPIQHVTRIVGERLEVDGVTLRPGRLVHLLLGAANRDERRFPDPARFDVGRDPNPHLSFSAGHHLCLGAGLGRLEAAVVLDRLLARCVAFEPAGPAVRRPMQVFRSYERIPVRMRVG